MKLLDFYQGVFYFSDQADSLQPHRFQNINII